MGGGVGRRGFVYVSPWGRRSDSGGFVGATFANGVCLAFSWV